MCQFQAVTFKFSQNQMAYIEKSLGVQISVGFTLYLSVFKIKDSKHLTHLVSFVPQLLIFLNLHYQTISYVITLQMFTVKVVRRCIVDYLDHKPSSRLKTPPSEKKIRILEFIYFSLTDPKIFENFWFSSDRYIY